MTRKRILMLSVILFMLVGCLPKRQVLEGNLFKSSSPTLAIKVAPPIAYLGMTESSQISYGAILDSRYKTVPSRYKVYYFAEIQRNNKAKRLLFIEISHLVEEHWYYLDTFHDQWEDYLDLGKEKLGGQVYKTASLIASLKGSDFAEHLNSRSYFLADCYALKVCNRIYGESNMLTIWYGEDCEQFGQRFDGSEMDDDQKRNAQLKALGESFTQALTFQD
jgi:hypothetical protein